MKTYGSRGDVVAEVVRSIDPLGEGHADEIDLDHIIDQAYDYQPDTERWVQTADVEEFWEIVRNSPGRTLP
jgi:hypothetical protein